MKTAISIPDDVFRRAARLAKKLKLSRSEFFTKAAERWVATFDEAAVTASYDSAFSEAESSTEALFRRRSTNRALAAVEWDDE